MWWVFERFARRFLTDTLPLSDCLVQRYTTHDLRHSRIHILFRIHLHVHIHIVLGHGPSCIGFAVDFSGVLCICRPWLRLCRRLMALLLSTISDTFGVVLVFFCDYLVVLFWVSNSFYHCFRCLRHVGYLDHFICHHHLRRHQLISRHHDASSASSQASLVHRLFHKWFSVLACWSFGL